MKFATLLLALQVLLLSGCAVTDHRRAPMEHGDTSPRYFASPREAVTKTTDLLNSEDWKTLATYYDLTGSTVIRDELNSGRPFVRQGPAAPSLGHTSTKYRQPFTPGMAFDHVEPAENPNCYRVFVSIRVDQGGGMTQVGIDNFILRRSAAGYQLLLKQETMNSLTPPATSSPSNVVSSDESSILIQFRPALADRLAKLPAAEAGSLIALLDALEKAKLSMAKAPMTGMTHPVPLVPGSIAYEPVNAELLASEAGRRIESVPTRTPPAKIMAELHAAVWNGRDQGYGRPASGADAYEDSRGAGAPRC